MPADAVSISTRARPALLDERLAHPVAMHLRQVAIEHDHVVVVDRGLPQAGRAVKRDIHRHALALQTERDRLGQLRLILDHQHSHSPSRGVATEWWHGGWSGPGNAAVTAPVTALLPPVSYHFGGHAIPNLRRSTRSRHWTGGLRLHEPNTGGSTVGQGDPASAAKALAFSRCMRSHGVSNFPDPTGGELKLQVQRTPGSTR